MSTGEKYKHLTDEQLRELEERMYDDEIAGVGDWHERDQVIWEMNRRGMMSRKPNYKPDSIPGEVRLSSDNPIEISGRDGRGMHRAVLRHVADVGTVDLRKISEPFRQRLIDLAMMEPPLVDVDADRVTLTDAGRAALNRTYLDTPGR